MKKLFVFLILGGFGWPSISQAIDLKQSKFTQVVNSVEVISADQSQRAATVNDIFKLPDVLRTGANSRAEMVADDKTITRVGANTIFSYDQASRTIDLQQGSLLFHSLHGKGGGSIHTASATASVLGTTIIVSCTANGGFKVLDMEGSAKVQLPGGNTITLNPGEMIFIFPGGGASPIIIFNLGDQVDGSLLVNGFDNALPSMDKIKAEIARQLAKILKHKFDDSDLLIGDTFPLDAVQVQTDISNRKDFQQPPVIIGGGGLTFGGG